LKAASAIRAAVVDESAESSSGAISPEVLQPSAQGNPLPLACPLPQAATFGG
jgi:hypothetical protein